MKNNYFKTLFVLGISSLILSCDTNDNDTILEETSTKEYKYLRLLVSDENSTTLTLVNPLAETVSTFEAKYAKSTLYASESGRFAAILHREKGVTETFDSGFENHGDHVDVKGTPKFGALTAESLSPTHFKSKLGEIMTFNDGDGTLSVGKEANIHTAGAKFKTINAGLKAHHGAMATFLNGNYAITEKDNSVAGTLPERVKIIDNTGKTVFESTLQTKGIHGNASDGKFAVFGSASGILVVESNGKQKLIPHPTNFDTAWFGTILETNVDGKFIGYTAAKGAYLIDVVNNAVKPIIENTEIMQCKMSYNLDKLAILLHSGAIKLFNLKSISVEKEGKIIGVTAKDSKQKPQLVFSQKSLYITLPTTGEIAYANWSDLASLKKIKVSSTPYRIAIIGHENSKDH